MTAEQVNKAHAGAGGRSSSGTCMPWGIAISRMPTHLLKIFV
jgi:hypothetical protein